jgi:hypothetical protein
MIERTAEFNAQVLAFLTGDPRYLDYVETPSEAEEDVEEAEESEEAETDLYARDGEASQNLDLAAPPEETSDLTPPGSDDSEPERDEEKPNVFRKREGSYSDRAKEDEPEQPDASLGDGIEGDERPRSRPRRTPPGEDVIPQLPEDLFDWPEARDESRSRERPRAVFPEERGDDEPEEPSRS